MGKILIIDSSKPIGRVIIGEGSQTITSKSSMESFAHLRDMPLMVESVLKENALAIKDLDAIAINLGPGSYTALRVGMSLTKGLCYGLDIPIIGISNFDILLEYIKINELIGVNEQVIGLCMHARADELYIKFYDRKLNLIKEAESYYLNNGNLSEVFPGQKILLVGEGINTFSEVLTPMNILYKDVTNTIEASVCVSLNSYNSGVYEDLAYSVPDYFKAPNITKSKKKFF